MPKTKVTEKLREKIRDRVMELTPGYRWHVIALRERESVEKAYLRIDKDGHAEVYSDDAVTMIIYGKSRGRQLTAERDIQWLKDNDLFIGSKFQAKGTQPMTESFEPEEEADEPEEEAGK